MVRASKKTRPKIFVGTSGWTYYHWKGVFYPPHLSSSDYLKFYSQHFNTVEINYSFYHLPKASTFQNWYQQTPKGFVFSVKVPRTITHIRRLQNVEETLFQFLENAQVLKEKLGPVLFQFPPSFKVDKDNLKKFKTFLKLLSSHLLSTTRYSPSTDRYPLKFAFEFRHPSWIDEGIFNLLKKYNFAWVVSDSSRYPKKEAVTANFIYIRMHGPKSLFSSKYSSKEIKELAQKIKNWSKTTEEIYVYFNNDFYGYALENAKTLINLLNKV